MLHQYEEHDDDRFRRFVNATLGAGREILTPFDTFVINIVGVWGVDALAFALAARVDVGLGLIAVHLSLVNGAIHALQAIAMRRANPGLYTAIGLFLPLGGRRYGSLPRNPASRWRTTRWAWGSRWPSTPPSWSMPCRAAGGWRRVSDRASSRC